MGLTVSHGAFDGGFHEFNRLRKAVADAIGGSYPPHKGPTWSDRTVYNPDWWYWGPGCSHDRNPGLSAFFRVNDSNAEIPWRTCREIARELKAIQPLTEKGPMGSAIRQFRKGAQRAAKARESLKLY